VIVAGQALLRDGSPVRVVPPLAPDGRQSVPTVDTPAAAAMPVARTGSSE